MVRYANALRRRFQLLMAVLVLAACGNSDADTADTLTQRQRDSIVAESKLPGARAVQGALRATDAAAARAATLDSISR
jgi:hypothetical protein